MFSIQQLLQSPRNPDALLRCIKTIPEVALDTKEDYMRRVRAIIFLGTSDDPDAVSPLLKCLKDKHSGIRGWALEMLDELLPEIGLHTQALAAIKKMIRDPDPAISKTAKRIIGSIKGGEKEFRGEKSFTPKFPVDEIFETVCPSQDDELASSDDYVPFSDFPLGGLSVFGIEIDELDPNGPNIIPMQFSEAHPRRTNFFIPLDLKHLSIYPQSG